MNDREPTEREWLEGLLPEQRKNDPLGEALARLDRTKAPNIYRPDIEPIVAAARKWEALTNHDPEMIDRIAVAIQPYIDVDSATEHEWMLAQRYNARIATRAVVDALTDTADE